MIILLSDTGVGISSGFSATAAVAYASANTTTYFNITLPDPLNEDQISWLGMYSSFVLYVPFKKVTVLIYPFQ